ncbi:hypothetical protein NEUTE1DRAFT_117337 [Neurospora tetrasperma FGSC 2508]|uniref:Uncharacterized protein n=1 Tax=Neurospora tetrasperma (strain FGSC 2508 / ATCC MYA-4615 / P0657) TaxID=510951 RepID=F8MQ17_NEUT8|nr:uncharacterized protein NEUTE1DRAFT_117337 [Neurospora tetrasperma FGSC 2508]EGO56447.1 hypothetical protein NEUTE1DRAFT_117337 [Neurospora tetrasperma FGSC 2508]EGZ70688.1 hypothetical protein NEUTE2DRAFT_145138 [Neurospora tetrasperma FGSC 2509]
MFQSLTLTQSQHQPNSSNNSLPCVGLLTLVYKTKIAPLVTITMQFRPVSSTPIMLGNAEERPSEIAIPVQSP